MMYNYRIVTAYEGTVYAGWQRLRDSDNTVQGQLERVLSQCLGRNTRITGAGRTDAGVHAMGQVANFHTAAALHSKELRERMNTLLPEDIRVCSVSEAGPGFHSRYDATGKIYEYTLDRREKPDVFQRRFTQHCSEELDLKAMHAAAAILEGKHDFRNFTTRKGEDISMVRNIYRIGLTADRHLLHMRFEGNGFLQQMIRILSGVLVETGSGRMGVAELNRLLDEQERRLAARPLPAKGLCLIKVTYE